MYQIEAARAVRELGWKRYLEREVGDLWNRVESLKRDVEASQLYQAHSVEIQNWMTQHVVDLKDIVAKKETYIEELRNMLKLRDEDVARLKEEIVKMRL